MEAEGFVIGYVCFFSDMAAHWVAGEASPACAHGNGPGGGLSRRLL